MMADAQLFPMMEVIRSAEHDGSRRLMIFSGRSNHELAMRIASRLDVDLGRTTLKTFKNGEIYARFDESVRGGDVFLVQSCSKPVNANLMELLIMADARRAALIMISSSTRLSLHGREQDWIRNTSEPRTDSLKRT